MSIKKKWTENDRQRKETKICRDEEKPESVCALGNKLRARFPKSLWDPRRAQAQTWRWPGTPGPWESHSPVTRSVNNPGYTRAEFWAALKGQQPPYLISCCHLTSSFWGDPERIASLWGQKSKIPAKVRAWHWSQDFPGVPLVRLESPETSRRFAPDGVCSCSCCSPFLKAPTSRPDISFPS